MARARERGNNLSGVIRLRVKQHLNLIHLTPQPTLSFPANSFQGALLLLVFVSFGGTSSQILHREHMWPGYFVARRFSGSVASLGIVGVWI